MSALTNHGENLGLNFLFNTETVTRPTAWYVALHTEDPTEAGNVGEVVTGTDADYVRKSITFGAESGGQVLSTNQVSWTVNSASAGYTVTHISICDAASAGNVIAKGALLASRTLAANDVLTFNVGEIVASLD